MIKEITSKSGKTDADFEEIARLEFMGGLYLDKDGPILPDFVIEGVVRTGAKKLKNGPVFKSGVFCLKHARLEYDGPRDPDEMWADGRFRDSRMVVVGRNRILRTRPIFNDWAAVIDLNYDPDIVKNRSLITLWVKTAENQAGFCDDRPRFGRFVSELV